MKAFANIWLAPQLKPPPSVVTLVSSTETLFTVDDFEDDPHLLRTVSERLTGDFDTQPDEVESEASLYRPPPSTIFKKSRVFQNASMYLIKSCIDQLDTIAVVHRPEAGTYLDGPFLYRTLSDRFGKMQTDYDLVVIGGTYMDMHKLQKDVEHIILILKELYNEINVYSASTCLDIFAEIHFNVVEDEEHLNADVQRKNNIYENMLAEFKFNRDDMKRKFEDMETQVSQMTTEWKNLTDYSDAAVNYAKCWQDSRQEQNSLILKAQEGNHESVIEGLEQKMLLEDLCYESIAEYYEQTREDQISEIERWMEEYDKEFDEREMKIYKMQHDTERIVAAKESLQKVYDKRGKEMEDWLRYKRIKKEKEERVALEYQAATMIQAWWRGEMVRKRLGPYSKKKKGKKGDKKDKKKKTKK